MKNKTQGATFSERRSLDHAFTSWLKSAFRSARIPNANLSKIKNLQGVKEMLAENVIEWTKHWKEEGLKEGRKVALLEILTSRFNRVSKNIRGKIEKITCQETLRIILRQAISSTSLKEFDEGLEKFSQAIISKGKPKVKKK